MEIKDNMENIKMKDLKRINSIIRQKNRLKKILGKKSLEYVINKPYKKS